MSEPKSFTPKVYSVTIRFQGGGDGWANVIAWTESEAEDKVRDHYGNENILCIPAVTECMPIKFVPDRAPHETNLQPRPLGSDDLVP